MPPKGCIRRRNEDAYHTPWRANLTVSEGERHARHTLPRHMGG